MFLVEPYLYFNGNCEEAFNFYKSVFGGDFTGIMRYKDMPGKGADMPTRFRDKILHISLPVGKDIIMMGSDTGPGSNAVNYGNNIVLALNVDNAEDARRLYKNLSEEGKVMMPLEKTFWAELYAMFTDKFGINWNISYGTEK